LDRRGETETSDSLSASRLASPTLATNLPWACGYTSVRSHQEPEGKPPGPKFGPLRGPRSRGPPLFPLDLGSLLRLSPVQKSRMGGLPRKGGSRQRGGNTSRHLWAILADICPIGSRSEGRCSPNNCSAGPRNRCGKSCFEPVKTVDLKNGENARGAAVRQVADVMCSDCRGPMDLNGEVKHPTAPLLCDAPRERSSGAARSPRLPFTLHSCGFGHPRSTMNASIPHRNILSTCWTLAPCFAL